MKEIEDDTKKGKIYGAHWIGRINITKMTILFKATQNQLNSYQNTNRIFSQN